MRVIAAGEDVIRAREIDRELERTLIEVDRVVVEPAEIRRRRPIDVRTAILERVKAAVEPLGEVRNRAAEMAERPSDLRKALDDAAEDERGGGECRIEEEAAQRPAQAKLKTPPSTTATSYPSADAGRIVPRAFAQNGRLALPACACNWVIYVAWATSGRPGI